MFNSTLKEEINDLKNEIADLQRSMQQERYGREKDKELLTSKLELSHYRSRDDMRTEKLKAEARADAAEEIAARAEEYAEKAVEMAERCAADFGNAVGELTDKVMELAALLKPEAPELHVVKVDGPEVEVNNDL